MKILVTGANGNIGRQLVQTLRKKHEVVSIIRNGPSDKDYPSYTLDLPGQIGDADKIFATEKPDAVVHLAALLGGVCEDDTELTERVNVEATQVFGKLAAEHGVKKFIFFSTAAVYKQTDKTPTDETHNIDPQNAYGKSKLKAEAELSKIASGTETTKYITLRPFNVYGPGFDRSLVYMLIHSTPEKPQSLFGFDNMYRDYIHVSDLVDAVKLSLGHDFTEPHTILNIGSGLARSNADLVRDLEAAGAHPFYTKSDADNLNVSWSDISAAKNILGFDPSTKIVVDN